MKGIRRKVSEIEKDAGPVAVFVRQRRKLLGYTQEELSGRVGVGIRFIKELELGKKQVRMDKVNQVLAFFGAGLVPVELKPGDAGHGDG